MPYITGRNAYIAIGSQTGPGAAANPTVYLSLSGDSGVEVASDVNIIEPQGTLYPTLYWVVGTWITGRIEANLHPLYDTTLLQWILSRDNTGEAPYFTIVQAYGSALVYRFVDCKINTATLACRVPEVVTLTMEFYGKTQMIGTWSAPTLPTGLVWVSHDISIQLGGQTYNTVSRAIEITINNNIAAPRDMLRFGTLGPIALPAGDITIDGRLTLDVKTSDSEVNVDTISFINNLIGGNRESSLTITLARGSYTRTINLPKVVFGLPTGFNVPSGAAGTPRTVDITFNALAPDSTTPAISIS